LIVKKPSKMRWEYASPEEKLFVSDGTKVYSYFPMDRQVIVSDVPVDDRAASPGLFLAGHGRLTEDFVASFEELPEDMPSDGVALKLVPRVPRPDYEWLVLVADPKDLTLRGLLWTDAQGGTSSFAFTNLKENLEPTDKQFVFTIPHGVEVVTDAPAL
jgi:outer membrane lipoprotein carrier protein